MLPNPRKRLPRTEEPLEGENEGGTPIVWFLSSSHQAKSSPPLLREELETRENPLMGTKTLSLRWRDCV